MHPGLLSVSSNLHHSITSYQMQEHQLTRSNTHQARTSPRTSTSLSRIHAQSLTSLYSIQSQTLSCFHSLLAAGTKCASLNAAAETLVPSSEKVVSVKDEVMTGPALKFLLRLPWLRASRLIPSCEGSPQQVTEQGLWHAAETQDKLTRDQDEWPRNKQSRVEEAILSFGVKEGDVQMHVKGRRMLHKPYFSVDLPPNFAHPATLDVRTNAGMLAATNSVPRIRPFHSRVHTVSLEVVNHLHDRSFLFPEPIAKIKPKHTVMTS